TFFLIRSISIAKIRYGHTKYSVISDSNYKISDSNYIITATDYRIAIADFRINEGITIFLPLTK
ncbi:hypothetical protein AAH034_17130, partial [Parabacteroides merdae]|uniref:hypothetical protein n=1 Tax=Parabacteroides merdae TaxID=46503 RepID=UPI0039B570F2